MTLVKGAICRRQRAGYKQKLNEQIHLEMSSLALHSTSTLMLSVSQGNKFYCSMSLCICACMCVSVHVYTCLHMHNSLYLSSVNTVQVTLPSEHEKPLTAPNSLSLALFSFSYIHTVCGKVKFRNWVT